MATDAEAEARPLCPRENTDGIEPRADDDGLSSLTVAGRPGIEAEDCPNRAFPDTAAERVVTGRLNAPVGTCVETAPRAPSMLRCVGEIPALELARTEDIPRTAEPLSAALDTDCEFTNAERGTAVIPPATRWLAK